jgi:hypothetical protein
MKMQSLLLLALGCCNLYGANILLNPGFESPVVGSGNLLLLGSGSSALTSWTVTGGSCGGTPVIRKAPVSARSPSRPTEEARA